MIALGTLVAYSRQAAVFRREKPYVTAQYGEWDIPAKERRLHGLTGEIFRVGQAIDGIGTLRWGGRFFATGCSPEIELVYTDGRGNKTIGSWETHGSGVVIGRVQKQYGTSVSWSGEDAGYFENHGHVHLYVVRHRLDDTTFIYVPEDSLRPAVLS